MTLPDYFIIILKNVPKDQPVFVISNANNPFSPEKYRHIQFINVNDLNYLEKFQNFKDVYVHLSTHSLEFELACFERFFALESLLEIYNIESAWHLDTDVWPTPLLHQFNGFELVFSSPYEDLSVASGHTSKFSLQNISKFTTFLTDVLYQEHLEEMTRNFSERLQKGLLGGICDMRAIAFWLRTLNSREWYNSYSNPYLETYINHYFGNLQVEILGKHATSSTRKIGVRTNERFFRIRLDTKVYKYASLHFQGQYKNFIPILNCFRILSGRNTTLHLMLRIFTKWKLVSEDIRGKRINTKNRFPHLDTNAGPESP